MHAFHLLMAFGLAASPADFDTVYITPMSHNDIGFTAPPREVAASAAKRVEQALQLARKDPDYVWNVEVFWELDQWLDPARQPGLPPAPAGTVTNRQPAASRSAQDELLDLVRKGRFGIGASYVNPHTSLMSDWALDQLFRVPTQWAKDHGVTLDWAVIDDVPGHPPDLPRFLKANGVRYLLLGVNQSLSKPLPEEVCNNPFWWEAPDGSRVLTWIASKSYTEAFTEYGIDPGTARFFNSKVFKQKEPLEVMRFGIEKLQNEYRGRHNDLDSVVLMHAFDNWDAGAAGRLPEAVRLWNQSTDRPRIVLATPGQFFRHIEEKYGPKLPVRRGGFGGQWELVRTNGPSAMARARAFEAKLRAAQKPSVEDIRQLLVYWEHSYSLGTPWPNYLTHDKAVEHNQQQWQMVSSWPMPARTFQQAPALPPPASQPSGILQSNQLYLAGSVFLEWRDLKPIPKDAVVESTLERTPEGYLRCRHRIDRRKLPDRASVIWAWRLADEEIEAPITVQTAMGSERWPNDGLGGYAQYHWVAPWGFQIGSTRYVPHGAFAFARPPGRRGWLLSYVLGQGLSATFKGGQKGRMTFEEVFQGEDPIFEFAIDIDAGSPASSGR